MRAEPSHLTLSFSHSDEIGLRRVSNVHYIFLVLTLDQIQAGAYLLQGERILHGVLLSLVR